MNKYFTSYSLLKGLIIALFIISYFPAMATRSGYNFVNVTPKDSLKKDTVIRKYGWDFSAEFDSRQVYYGTYDTAKIRSFSPEIDYLFKSGILLSLTTISYSHQSKKISALGLGAAWQHDINDDWCFDIGYSRFFSQKQTGAENETDIILQKQEVTPNDFFTSLANENDIINTSLKLDLLTGTTSVTDFVGDLQNSHDFDILYKENHYEFSLGIKNDFYFGSVNSISYISKSRQTVRRGVVTKVTPVRTSGALYDNAAIPIMMKLKRFSFIPELDCDIPFKKFVYTEGTKASSSSTYLPGSPLLYFVVSVEYDLQKKARHRK